MAENENGQEKSEEPTGRRLQKAREKGQVPRSRELGTMAVLTGGAAAILIFGPWMGESLFRVMRGCFSLSREAIFDPHMMALKLLASVKVVALMLTPFLTVLFVAGVAGTVLVGGWLFTGQSFSLEFNKLNPISGLKKIISVNSLMELVKGLAKALLVIGVALIILNHDKQQLLALPNEPLRPGIAHVLNILEWSFFWLSSVMIIIAIIDVPFQLYNHKKQLRMTKQEVKEEFKDTEGKPEVKGKIRRLQYEMAQRRMMQAVPQADVVITNPTHYAVALRYDQHTMLAPVLVAKGTDKTAMKIQEIAREYKVEIMRMPPLTRAIYFNTELDQEIPEGLYVAVAQVLAYLFQLRKYRKGQGNKPAVPDFTIPDDLKR